MNAPTAGVLTTVVGSYPAPAWLVQCPSEQALADATRVVIATQERAGIDLVCDGELYRFDVNHPETNGMIEYFVHPMDGIRPSMTFGEIVDFESQATMGFRTRPAAVCEGPITSGLLNLAAPCRRAKELATQPLKFALTGPHMLAKTLIDQGADMITQHTDSPAPLQVAQNRGVMGFGQASDMEAFAPNAQLTAIIDDWAPGMPSAKVGATKHICFSKLRGNSASTSPVSSLRHSVYRLLPSAVVTTFSKPSVTFSKDFPSTLR